jgi:hypothetical protein
MVALFVSRAMRVGFIDAVAEALGVANFEAYVRWREQYSPLHPELFSTPLHSWLDTQLADALRNTTHQAQAIRVISRREGSGIYSVPLLSARFCRLLSEEIAHFSASRHKGTQPPNDMHANGVGLEDIGLGALAAALATHVLTPLAAALYTHTTAVVRASEADVDPALSEALEVQAAMAGAASSCCTSHHAFAVEYDPGTQAGLDAHHDASDVTLNVNLKDADEVLSVFILRARCVDVSSVVHTDSSIGAVFSTDASCSRRICHFDDTSLLTSSYLCAGWVAQLLWLCRLAPSSAFQRRVLSSGRESRGPSRITPP